MAVNSIVYVAIVTGDTPADVIKDRLVEKYDNQSMGIEKIRDLLERVASGVEDGKVLLFQDKGDGTAATGTIACTQASAVAGDTVTVAGVTFTVATSPSSNPADGQFAALTSDTVMGAALAAAINAHPALKGLCTATNGSGTVTVTLTNKGLFGNLLRMTETGSSMVVTNPTNGAIGTVNTSLQIYRKGL